MLTTIQSLNQNSLGLFNECGFFSYWNCICLLNDNSTRLEPGAFHQFFTECLNILKGIYTTPDLSPLYIEVLNENHPLLKRLEQENRLIVFPDLYMFGELILSPNQVSLIHSAINSLSSGKQVAFVLGEVGHYYSLYCKDNQNMVVCDSLNTRIPQDKNFSRFTKCISNNESFTNFYSLCMIEHFIEQSIIFQQKYGFENWKSIPQPLDSFQGMCLSQLSAIMENISSITAILDKKLLSIENTNWVQNTLKMLPENNSLSLLSSIIK
jgi:hypothetical protein